MNEWKEIINRHPFFHDMKPEHQQILAGGASEVSFEPGDILFREGEPATEFYLIESGRIALEAHELADGTALIEYLGPGDVLGWSWLFAPFVWHFRARAVEPTEAIALSGSHLLTAAEQNHDFGYELMKRVAQVVIHRLHATRERLMADEVEAALEG